MNASSSALCASGNCVAIISQAAGQASACTSAGMILANYGVVAA